MIRSLGAPGDISLDDTFIPRRNMTREQLETGLNNGDMFWIDITDPEEDEIRWLEQTLALHPVVVADLLREDRRPALLVYPKYLFLSLFQPYIHLNRVSGQEIHCIVGENYFVTVRRSNCSSVDEAYKRVAQNYKSWRRGIPYFLYLTVQQVIDAYYPLLDGISEQLNAIEEAILTNERDSVSQQRIYHIKHYLIALRQMVAPQREVLANVIGEERLASDSTNRDLFRHLYERLLRIYDVIDSQRDLSSNVLDLLQTQESAKLSDAVGRLTILSMVFLPLTFLIGLFELNFATTQDPLVLPISGRLLFGIIIVAMIGSVTLMTWFFRRKGWI